MRIYIRYEQVLDHIDILEEEFRKCCQLKEVLELAFREVAAENPNQRRDIQDFIKQAEKLQENIAGRRRMIPEMVAILKKAGIQTDNTVQETYQKIQRLGGEV